MYLVINHIIIYKDSLCNFNFVEFIAGWRFGCAMLCATLTSLNSPLVGGSVVL
jgi:hypothetical protein